MKGDDAPFIKYIRVQTIPPAVQSLLTLHLQFFQTNFPNQIIAYGLETDEHTWRVASDRDRGKRWLQASDLQGDDAPFIKYIRVQTIPANFILEDKGVVIAKNVHGKALMDLVKRQIEEK